MNVPKVVVLLMLVPVMGRADERQVWMTQVAAAEGSAAAQNRLGVYYELGLGVGQDDREAVRWFRLSAEQGYGEAQVNLGEMYEAGRGVEQSRVVAERLYLLACRNGWPCGCKHYKILTGKEAEQQP